MSLAGLSTWFSFAVGLIALFLVYEHAIVNPQRLAPRHCCLFTVNGAISVFSCSW
jgi:hypothetical protein